jgi:hypothetical protein
MNTLLPISSWTLVLSAPPNSKSPALPVQQGKPHPMACSDYSQGKVFLVSAQGKVERSTGWCR